MKLESLLDTAAKKRIALDRKKPHWDQTIPLLTIQGYEALHSASRNGCNAEAGLLELITSHREIADLRATRRNGNYSIYVQYATTQTPQGFRRHIDTNTEAYRLVVRRFGKTIEIQIPADPVTEPDQLPFHLRRILNHNIDIIKSVEESSWRYHLSSLSDSAAASDFTKYPIRAALEEAGYTIIDLFKYHERFYIQPQYVRVRGTSIEFGIMSNHTYHSLPRTITIDFLPRIRTTRLAALGIETPGYYQHSAHHSVLASKVPESKRFHADFKRKQRNGTLPAVPK